jgi:hypothetical protein
MASKQQLKREAASSMMFRVPNDRKGQKFLAQMREYAVGGTRVWARGRGPRATHSRKDSAIKYNGRVSARMYDQDLPAALAERFAVYVSKPEVERVKREQRHASMATWRQRDLEQLNQQVTAAQTEQKRLDRDRAELMRQRDALQTELTRQREISRNLKAENERLRVQRQRLRPSSLPMVVMQRGEA